MTRIRMKQLVLDEKTNNLMTLMGCSYSYLSRHFKSSSGTPVSSTNKTDRHDITEILLKVA
jgi:AraC-like DNA-binding protein